jgi:hypothetical protein
VLGALRAILGSNPEFIYDFYAASKLSPLHIYYDNIHYLNTFTIILLIIIILLVFVIIFILKNYDIIYRFANLL